MIVKAFRKGLEASESVTECRWWPLETFWNVPGDLGRCQKAQDRRKQCLGSLQEAPEDIPEGIQDAQDAPERFRTFLEVSGTLWDALGRLGTLWDVLRRSRNLWDALGQNQSILGVRFVLL